MTIAYFNGEYLPLERVKVSPLDRGFTFAESIYDVIPAHHGHLFAQNAHLARMAASAAGIGIDFDAETVATACAGVLAENSGEHGSLYVQVTGGVDLIRKHRSHVSRTPTYLVVWQPAVSMPQRDCGIAAEIMSDRRWARCHLKTTNLAAATSCLQQTSAEEVIFERDGMVMEGASSNVFAVFGDEVITPPLNEYVLPGITRQLLLQELPKRQVTVKELALSVDQLAAADEVWITSSTREIFPVTLLDNAPVGDGQVGQWYQLARGIFNDYKTRWLIDCDVDVQGSLLEFPCHFSLKTFGEDTAEFRDVVDAIVAEHVMEKWVHTAKDKPSSKGKFIARSVTFTAHSKFQLDQIYQALTVSPVVKMAL